MRSSDMMMLKILLKILLSPMSRSGMPPIAYAEFMALRGQGTGHCMYTHSRMPSGAQKAWTCTCVHVATCHSPPDPLKEASK